MLARLLGAAFGGKATVASGVLLLAGALITNTGAGPEASPGPEDQVPVVAAALLPVAAPTPTRAPEPSRKAEVVPAPTASPAACVNDAQARDGALQALRGTLAASRAALERLGSQRSGSRATEALDRAGAMLANIDRTAEDLVSNARCAGDVREVTERATHAMDMIVDLAKSATAPTPTPSPRVTARPKGHR